MEVRKLKSKSKSSCNTQVWRVPPCQEAQWLSFGAQLVEYKASAFAGSSCHGES